MFVTPYFGEHLQKAQRWVSQPLLSQRHNPSLLGGFGQPCPCAAQPAASLPCLPLPSRSEMPAQKSLMAPRWHQASQPLHPSTARGLYRPWRKTIARARMIKDRDTADFYLFPIRKSISDVLGFQEYPNSAFCCSRVVTGLWTAAQPNRMELFIS